MTTSLEKIFFKYILQNKRYFSVVEPSFFKNPEINLIYEVVHKYMIEHTDSDAPKAKQIFEMVKLVDKEKKITPKTFKLLIQTELKEMDEERFIKPKIHAWILKERIRIGSDQMIDEVRGIENDELDLEKMEVSANKIREMINESTLSNFIDDDNSLGSDFDDADHHIQDHSTTKVQSGWPTMDRMLGGGFDVSTLSILMGTTNSGKSVWLQNIASNAANMGYNVVYFTLEMSEAKVLKRLGSMRLNIPINNYDEKSVNPEYIQNKIDNLRKTGGGTSTANDPAGLFNKKIGKINVKFFAAGTANINHLEAHLTNLQQKKNFTPDLIIVDYITLMAPVKGLNVEGNLYLKGKHLAESLRALAAKWESPLVTVIQVAKDAWNANDVTLDKIPESKAIAETSDTFWAIIRTEDMKRDNKYILKLLKQRDGDFTINKAKFDLNPKYLTIENDQLVNDLI